MKSLLWSYSLFLWFKKGGRQLVAKVLVNAYLSTFRNFHGGDRARIDVFDPLFFTFVSPSAFSRRAVVSYWRKYVHEVLVNCLGGLSLPRKRVVRLTDRPNMTLDVYRGRKTTIQQYNNDPFC